MLKGGIVGHGVGERQHKGVVDLHQTCRYLLFPCLLATCPPLVPISKGEPALWVPLAILAALFCSEVELLLCLSGSAVQQGRALLCSESARHGLCMKLRAVCSRQQLSKQPPVCAGLSR
jgi:hypothetical protein